MSTCTVQSNEEIPVDRCKTHRGVIFYFGFDFYLKDGKFLQLYAMTKP